MLPVKDTAAWKEPAGAGESGDHGGPLPGSASKIASHQEALAIDGVLDPGGDSEAAAVRCCCVSGLA